MRVLCLQSIPGIPPYGLRFLHPCLHHFTLDLHSSSKNEKGQMLRSIEEDKTEIDGGVQMGT